MRDIAVSTSVFALIWALRRPGEESEDEILERVLGGFWSDMEERTKKKRGSGDDVALAHHTCPRVDPPSYRHLGKERWVDSVSLALRELGGTAHLSTLYDAVEKRRKKLKLSIPRTLDATVRRTLEDYSSDSMNFRGMGDLFRMAKESGRGVWALR